MATYRDNFGGSGALIGQNGWAAAAGSPQATRDGSGNVYPSGAGGIARDASFTPAGADVRGFFTLKLKGGTQVAQGICLRMMPDGSCYYFGSLNGAIGIYYVDSSVSPTLLSGSTTPLANGNFEADATGTGTVTLTLKLNGSTVLTASDATHNLPAGGVGGLFYGTSASPPLLKMSDVVFSDPAVGLTIGEIVVTYTGSNVIAANVGPTIGGTGATSIQWYRSTATGTLGNAVSGQTIPVLNDNTVAPGQPYYLTVKATDSSSPAVTVTSAQVQATTPAASATHFVDQFAGSGALAGQNGWAVVSEDGVATRDGNGNLYPGDPQASGGTVEQSGFRPASSDVNLTWTLTQTASNFNTIGGAARVQPDGSCYNFAPVNGQLKINYVDSILNYTQIGTGSAPAATGAYELDVTGFNPVTLTVKQGGVVIMTASDSTFNLPAGYCGITVYGNSTGAPPLALSNYGASNAATVGGALSAGTLAITGVGATSLPYAVTGTSGGVPPYSFAFQESPDGTTWSDLPGEPTASVGLITGLTAGLSGHSLRAKVADSTPGTPLNATSAAAPYSTMKLVAVTDPNLSIGDRNWTFFPGQPNSRCAANSNQQIEVTLKATGNIYAVVRSLDGATGWGLRYSVDKAPFTVVTVPGGARTIVPLLVGGTVGNHFLRFATDIWTGSGADLAGKTSTPSCLFWDGFLVDSGSTGTLAYLPAATTNHDWLSGTSYGEGGIEACYSMGTMFLAGLGNEIGGNLCISGSAWDGGHGWSSYVDRILHDPGGVSALVNGVLPARSITIMSSRNSPTSEAAYVQDAYTAIRAVFSGWFFIGPDRSDGGGFPITKTSADSIRATVAAIQAANPADTKFLLLDATQRDAEGLNYLDDGMTPVINPNSGVLDEPQLTLYGAGDGVHMNQEKCAREGAKCAYKVGTAMASGSGGGSSAPAAASSYIVRDWPPATTAGLVYSATAILQGGNASAAGTIVLPAVAGITWNGGTAGSPGSAPVASGANYAGFTVAFAAGSYASLALAHTGLGFTGGDATVGATTCSAASASSGGGGLDQADADLVVSTLLGEVGAIEAGRTFRQSLRKITASTAGYLDFSVAGFVRYMQEDGTEAFRIPAAGRTSITFGLGL